MTTLKPGDLCESDFHQSGGGFTGELPGAEIKNGKPTYSLHEQGWINYMTAESKIDVIIIMSFMRIPGMKGTYVALYNDSLVVVQENEFRKI